LLQLAGTLDIQKQIGLALSAVASSVTVGEVLLGAGSVRQSVSYGAGPSASDVAAAHGWTPIWAVFWNAGNSVAVFGSTSGSLRRLDASDGDARSLSPSRLDIILA